LQELIGRKKGMNAATLVAACREDLEEFRRSAAKTDDVTLFILSRS